MGPRRRTRKAVAKADVAEPRRSGRATSRSANVAEQSGLAMSTQNPEESSRTRTPRRSAARGKWSEEQLMTSEKSLLIDLDLVKLLAQPEAWNCLDESEKREILALLPPDVHPEAQAISNDLDAKIDPLPESFIRYSNNWRDGVRQFQLDLQNGRYDPEWLHQAQVAREQRENGDFDNFKEREYEQFWGQKQRVVWAAPAGESARVKMKTLIDEGVIQLGDIWKFYYVYGKGPGRTVIEKETRIHGINGAKLDFAVPSGERVFLRSSYNKAEQCSQLQHDTEGVKVDINTDQQPVKLASNGQDVKLDIDKESQPVSIPPNDKGTKDEEPELQATIADPNEDQMQLDTNADKEAIVASSNNQRSQESSQNFSVVIVSPGSRQDGKSKRNVPEPQPQPPVKRRRGRPPKNQSKQPVLEPPKEFEAFKKPAVSEEVDVPREPERAQNYEPQPSVMSILEAKIAESYRDGAEPSQPESDSSKLSYPLESPRPESSIPLEEEAASILTAKPEGNVTQPVMAGDSSIAHPDTATDSAEGPVKAGEDDIDTTAADKQHATPITTNGPDEIIVPNIASPQALVLKILQIDGRMPNGRTANAWKEIRCYRNNQDMGSLFDVREAWFLQHGQDE
ncbi:hypothetical protein N7457_006619 [Penicillium paradoxum]|uniref:uncharacterized protein n=1 Tax=Penicillium paradoxum TaxID=176176 RepID=UPI002547EC62|nr:uncharacterized protein N7457_006619 [Penicillium paradoxum]KAJ5778899.1 hypothetical protein N7457_006619 [Penicillium paradoxum]